MNIRWEYYVAIVESGSLKAAAEREHVVPQTMSHFLQRIEEMIGRELIRRDDFSLTSHGLVVYKAAKSILQIEREMLESLNAMDGTVC